MMKFSTKKVAMISVFAAVSMISFIVLKFDVTILGSRTSFHLSNTVVVLAGLLLEASEGAFAGAIGLFLADLMTGYVSSAPKTFILKWIMGYVSGFLAHQVFHLNHEENQKKRWLKSAVAICTPLLLNVFLDPAISYLFNRYILQVAADPSSIIAKVMAGVTLVNAILSAIIAILLYPLLYKPFRLVVQKGEKR